MLYNFHTILRVLYISGKYGGRGKEGELPHLSPPLTSLFYQSINVEKLNHLILNYMAINTLLYFYIEMYTGMICIANSADSVKYTLLSIEFKHKKVEIEMKIGPLTRTGYFLLL